MDFLSLIFQFCFQFFQVIHLKKHNSRKAVEQHSSLPTSQHLQVQVNSAAHLFPQAENLKSILFLFNVNSSPTLFSHLTTGIHGPTVKFIKEGQTWNFSFGIFLRAPFARTRASSTLWLARRSWICFSKGSGTKIYTPLLVATITFPGQSKQINSVYFLYRKKTHFRNKL